MRVFLILLLLSGCASYQRARDCQQQAGPEPYASAHLFGLVGALVMAGSDEHEAWAARVDWCMRGPK